MVKGVLDAADGRLILFDKTVAVAVAGKKSRLGNVYDDEERKSLITTR